jgi:branched-chain amino acid transport system permease protein
MSHLKAFYLAVAAALLLLLVGLDMPKWLLFLVTMAVTHGLVTLGVVVLLRGGAGSFGQGLFFAIGAYVAALAMKHFGMTDALLLVLFGGVAAGVVGAVVAPLLARYSGIFFAMLTLALSMVVYGILVKSTPLGGSDGFNLARPTLLGHPLSGGAGDYALYALTIAVAAIASWMIAIYFRSGSGLVSLAVRNNALRVEYLGASARTSLSIDFIIAAVCGGLGGALTALVLGHVDPNFAYWTTSGEFVFVAILSGHQSVSAVFIASLILEIVRSFSNLYFPNTWQLALGLFLLLVILFRPRGIGSLWSERIKRAAQQRRSRAPAQKAGGVS